MDRLEMRPACTMSGSDVLSALDALHADAALDEAYRLHLLARLDEIGHAKELGARDTTELLALRHRLNPTDLRRDLKIARALPKYGAVAAALPDPFGETSADLTPDTATEDEEQRPVRLHPAQAKAIVKALEKVPPTVPVDDLLVAEEQMVEAARYLSPDDLRTLGRKVVDTLDTDGPEPAEDQAYQQEALWLRPADHGIKFGGFLAAENAELLKTAIHGLSKPHKTVDGELDPRPRDKRQADALVTILEAATTGSTGTGPGVPHLTVTIDYTDLRTATAGAVGELVHGDNLSAAAVRRLACDAAILPIVLGSNSQPLDVGTEQRFVTRAMRRALNRRDKGCVICKAPPPQCHAHHIIHWADGGPTSIDNLALFCAAHHRAIHAGHWTVTITNGKAQVTRPTWADPPQHSPRPARTAWSARPRPAPGTPRPDSSASGSTGSAPSSTGSASGSTGSAPGSTGSGCGFEGIAQPRSDAVREPFGLVRLPQLPARSGPGAPPPSWPTTQATERLDPWGERPTEPAPANTG